MYIIKTTESLDQKDVVCALSSRIPGLKLTTGRLQDSFAPATDITTRAMRAEP